MPEYDGPYPAPAADRKNRATLRAKAARRGVDYPIPPTRSYGAVQIADSSIAFATHATWQREDLNGMQWLLVDDEMRGLPATPVIIDGVPVVPVRGGVEKPDQDFRNPPPF